MSAYACLITCLFVSLASTGLAANRKSVDPAQALLKNVATRKLTNEVKLRNAHPRMDQPGPRYHKHRKLVKWLTGRAKSY